MLSRYRGKTTCEECSGKRLRKEADYVLVGKKTISDLVGLPLDELYNFFKLLKLNKYEEKIGNRLLKEINNRLELIRSNTFIEKPLVVFVCLMMQSFVE